MSGRRAQQPKALPSAEQEIIVKHALPTRRLPDGPSLDHLKHQAKDLLDAFLSGEPAAITEVDRFYRDAEPATFALHDAQLVLARSYGYDSWPKLKAFIDGVTVSRLIDATRAGNLDAVRAVLDTRPELVNTVAGANDERRALHYAVMARMPEMTRLLLRYGADPYLGVSPHNEATSPLSIATERGYDEIAELLRGEVVRRFAAGPAGSVADHAALFGALHGNDEERALEILEKNPELVRHRMPHGATVLHAASGSLMTKLATWLLEHGADVNAQTDDGAVPLDFVGHGCPPEERTARVPGFVKLLQSHGAGLAPRSAVILGDEAYLRARHAAGNLPPAQDDRGWLLRLAVDHDRSEILKLLLSWGFDPDARTRIPNVDEVAFTWGMPLYQCARNGKHAMAEILLEHGADPNAHVYASGTPLSEAFGQRDERMIALLERYGGKPNPSMAGLYRRKDLALRLLAEHGDTPLPDDGFGSGPVAEQLAAAAARGGDAEILRIALDRIDWPQGDPRWYGPLTGPLGFWNHSRGPWRHFEWDRTTYLECFKLILERLGPPIHSLRFGATILHHIVTMGEHVTPEERVAFAAAGLDAGARSDIRDDLLKSTPLGWACRWGRPELARLFLDRGADPVEADADPWATPLAWAEKKGNAEILAILRSGID